MSREAWIERLTGLWLVTIAVLALGLVGSMFATTTLATGFDAIDLVLSAAMGLGYVIGGNGGMAAAYHIRAITSSLAGTASIGELVGQLLGHLTIAGFGTVLLLGMVAALCAPASISYDLGVHLSAPLRGAYSLAALWLLGGVMLALLGGGRTMFAQRDEV